MSLLSQLITSPDQTSLATPNTCNWLCTWVCAGWHHYTLSSLPNTKTSSASAMDPGHCSNIMSILSWKISCATRTPKGKMLSSIIQLVSLMLSICWFLHPILCSSIHVEHLVCWRIVLHLDCGWNFRLLVFCDMFVSCLCWDHAGLNRHEDHH